MAKKATTTKKPTKAATKGKPISKKPIKRQNTMETTAQEGRDFIARLEKAGKKKTDIKKDLPASKIKSVTRSKPSPKPATKSVKTVAKKPVPVKKAAPAKKAAPVKKAAVPAKAAVPVKAAAAPATSSLFSSSSTGFGGGLFSFSSLYGSTNVQKDIDSCKNIASTEVVDRGKLGKQIIKKSLKASTNEAQKAKQQKAKPLRTKTGERLAAGIIDVVFCCDTTSSMGSQLAQCLSTVKTIIKKIIDKTSGEGISVKFGFVAYRDHPPQDSTYLTCSYDLTTEEEILEFIGSLTAYGGGDFPEAAMDGLYVSSKYMSWRDSTHIPSLRYIFHIADAPPHGKEYSNSSSHGCPCELDINKVSHIINMKQIHYRFVGTGSSTDKMVEIFKEKIVDFEECKIDKAADMDIRISDMIIRELLPDMAEEEI